MSKLTVPLFLSLTLTGSVLLAHLLSADQKALEEDDAPFLELTTTYHQSPYCITCKLPLDANPAPLIASREKNPAVLSVKLYLVKPEGHGIFLKESLPLHGDER